MGSLKSGPKAETGIGARAKWAWPQQVETQGRGGEGMEGGGP